MLVEGIAITSHLYLIKYILCSCVAYVEGREDVERGAPHQTATQVVVTSDSLMENL